MAKGMHIGIGGAARKVKKAYIGINGTARKVKKIYLGIGGVARLAWQGTVPAGQVIFTSSQVWTVPEGVSFINIFAVGGGQSGGTYGNWSGGDSGGANGGCSGRTITNKNVAVIPGSSVSIVIGAGGVPYTRAEGSWNRGRVGGQSSVTVNGNTYMTPVIELLPYPTSLYQGGSGGGAGAMRPSSYGSFNADGCAGGTDGSDGVGTAGLPTNRSDLGQGSITRAFGESENTLYAGGGGGGNSLTQVDFYPVGGAGGAGGGGRGGEAASNILAGIMAQPGTPNTGGGGGGATSGLYTSFGNAGCVGASGGSGIVIVRWAEQ